MNRAEAVKLCKKFWVNIEESGVTKADYADDCPLCQWVSEGKGYGRGNAVEGNILWCRGTRRVCPLIKQYHMTCIQLGFEYNKLSPQAWFDAIEGLK